MGRRIRDSHTFAFLQGMYEAARFGECAGRTHATDHDWNEAYDRGMNVGEALRRVVLAVLS